jgi:DNA-binding MarR family transcriptional regulator
MLNQGRNITHPNHKVHANSKAAFQKVLLSHSSLKYRVRIVLFLELVKKPCSRRMIAETINIKINCVTSPIKTMIEKGVLYVTTGRCEISGKKVELLIPMEQKKEQQTSLLF